MGAADELDRGYRHDDGRAIHQRTIRLKTYSTLIGGLALIVVVAVVLAVVLAPRIGIGQLL